MSDVKGKLVMHIIEETEPGVFAYRHDAKTDEAVGMMFRCPCGCGSMGSIDFRLNRKGHPMWDWDGNISKPTISPSIHRLEDDGSSHWHGFLKEGIWSEA